MDTRINWVAALGAGVLYFMLGALWYAPFAFGPAFYRALGYAPGVVPAASTSMFLGPLLACMATVVGLALLVRWTRVKSQRQALALSTCTAVLFAGSAVATDAVAPNQTSSLTLLCVVGGYHLVGQWVSGAIVTRFRRE